MMLQKYDYEAGARSYARVREADPRIAAFVHAELGSARTVLNVGAGAGSYEPMDRAVVAVEPSAAMRARRRGGVPPVLGASAEALPFGDGVFDASMALLTIHHWPDLPRGLRELRRVTRGPVVVLTFDPDAPTDFWLADYVPEMVEVERRRYPALSRVSGALGGVCEVVPIPVPRDCSDRFQVALYARPEEFLDAEVRDCQSAWSSLPAGVEERAVAALAADLASGAWDARYGHLRSQPTLRCQLRVVIGRPA